MRYDEGDGRYDGDGDDIIVGNTPAENTACDGCRGKDDACDCNGRVGDDDNVVICGNIIIGYMAFDVIDGITDVAGVDPIDFE